MNMFFIQKPDRNLKRVSSYCYVSGLAAVRILQRISGNWEGKASLIVVGVGLILAGQPLAGSSGDVVINEVAWMGNGASANDEWIELYNTTDQAIDFTNWTLKAADDTPVITLSGTLPAHGYFLLERSDDNTVKDIAADQIYTGALSNDGEILFLKDPFENIIDTANGDNGSWPAGANPSGDPAGRATMERIDPLTPDSDANWGINNGIIRNGIDANGGFINGTPKNRNSVTNHSPSANAGPDQTVKVGDTVQLDGSGSSDPDNDPLGYSWSFLSKPTGSNTTLSGQDTATPTFVPDVVGDYSLKVTVDDGRGGSNSDQVRITANAPPTTDFTYFPEAPTTWDAVQFTDRSNDTDGVVIAWLWNFGDGETSIEKNPMHQYQIPKTYRVTLEVTDNDGLGDSIFKDVAISLGPGDVDGSCTLDVLDVRIVLQAALGLVTLTPDQFLQADVDGDGQVTRTDAKRLASHIIGIGN